MRCPPANQTDIIAEESRLHLICLALLNIFPSRGRLGTPRRRVFIHHAALRVPNARSAIHGAQRQFMRACPQFTTASPSIHSFLSPCPAGHFASLDISRPWAYRAEGISRAKHISRRRHIASAGYLAREAHLAPLASIHSFLAFPSRGRLGTRGGGEAWKKTV